MAHADMTVKVEAADLPQVKAAMEAAAAEIDELTRQRDSARAWAVELENRVEAARALVEAQRMPENGLLSVQYQWLFDALADPS